MGGLQEQVNGPFPTFTPLPESWLFHGPLSLALTESPGGSTRNLGESTEIHAMVAGGIGAGPTFEWSVPSGNCGTSTGPLLICPDNVTGPYTVSVSVRDPGDLPVVAALNYTVIRPTLGAPLASRGSADVGQPVTFTLPLPTGPAPTSIVWSGLPTGCLVPTGASVACAPFASGTYAIRGDVSYPNGTSVVGAALQFPVSNDPALGIPQIRTPGPVNATLDVAGSANLSAILISPGSGGPYRYSWTGLPAGCSSINASMQPCRPSSAGLFQVAVAVTDSNGQTEVSPPAILDVNPPLVIEPPTLLSGHLSLGAAANWTVSISGGTAPYAVVWSVAGDEVGQGPFLGYRFSSTGPVTVTVRANDSAGAVQSASVVVEVGPAVPATSGTSSTASPGATEEVIGIAALVVALPALLGVVYLLGRRRPPTIVHPPPGRDAPSPPAGAAAGSDGTSAAPPPGSPRGP